MSAETKKAGPSREIAAVGAATFSRALHYAETSSQPNWNLGVATTVKEKETERSPEG